MRGSITCLNFTYGPISASKILEEDGSSAKKSGVYPTREVLRENSRLGRRSCVTVVPKNVSLRSKRRLTESSPKFFVRNARERIWRAEERAKERSKSWRYSWSE